MIMSACSLSRNSCLFLTLALPISEQMRGLARPAGGGAGVYSTLRVEVKSWPRAPEVLIKEVSIARTVMRALHRNLEEFPGNQQACGRPGDWRRREADPSLRSGRKFEGPVHKYFQQIAKNLASGRRLVRVEVSNKSVGKPFIKSIPKRG